MVDSPYTGAALRTAHFAVRPSVPGVNVDHTTPDPEPDPFNPVPDQPRNQAGYDVWTVDPEHAGPSNQPNLAQVPVSHWWDGQPSVPTGIPYERAQQAMQERLIADHSVASYVPDGIRLYLHATEGQTNDFVVGRPSQYAGQEITEGPLAGLINGTNGYDQTNLPNEVYAGDSANVGRYRLGVKTNVWGLYENPIGKFGQEATLHAYTGLHPAFPVTRERMENTAPYTPSSSGTDHWLPAAPYQKPSLFSLPSETAITDYGVAADNDFVSEFEDRNGGFS
jgi:hypothetical protein